MNQIHPMANVHPKAQIGDNVIIEPFATVCEDVVIGDGTWIASGAYIMNGARIGRDCKIFQGAIIAGIPQDLKFKGEYTTMEIGDRTAIREYAVLHRGTQSRGKTVIGTDCLIMCYVHVAHDCLIGNHVILTGYTGLAGEVVVGDWAIIGGGSMAHQFVHIGTHAMISGGSLIRKDVPPYTKAAREPLSYVGINTVGLRRRGFTGDQILGLQDIYRYIFLKGLPVSEALSQVEQQIAPSPERDEVIQFIRESKRGIMKGYTSAIADDND
ncbi:MAG: acyl-ACP--UDP-N-acetylglucosamine O-acyltransferase [Bacteroidales bacterium]|nr:acyl-ACP--UDP-N-acetylglucosamine O-acyltransferase [Bacteroidales bacterium]